MSDPSESVPPTLSRSNSLGFGLKKQLTSLSSESNDRPRRRLTKRNPNATSSDASDDPGVEGPEVPNANTESDVIPSTATSLSSIFTAADRERIDDIYHKTCKVADKVNWMRVKVSHFAPSSIPTAPLYIVQRKVSTFQDSIQALAQQREPTYKTGTDGISRYESSVRQIELHEKAVYALEVYTRSLGAVVTQLCTDALFIARHYGLAPNPALLHELAEKADRFPGFVQELTEKAEDFPRLDVLLEGGLPRDRICRW
ncbi:Uu.00g118800.m01.CDS01 [Anthostomella pinea]|uniref:Uu.00g118800.m01.CDS01 n=1 Tax=Anthostomella pinea TaxID=933095 RepID=A0AAI8YH30_9PEZI|nr:Uu.00g118800.m01.CDS01 [Anthostomella pinea]